MTIAGVTTGMLLNHPLPLAKIHHDCIRVAIHTHICHIWGHNIGHSCKYSTLLLIDTN